jgi:hypothetical protein
MLNEGVPDGEHVPLQRFNGFAEILEVAPRGSLGSTGFREAARDEPVSLRPAFREGRNLLLKGLHLGRKLVVPFVEVLADAARDALEREADEPEAAGQQYALMWRGDERSANVRDR